MKKRFFLLLTILWLITTLIVIQVTYAKYITTISSGGKIDIASWRIVLNDQSINDNLDITNTLELIVPETNYYAADNIVPGAIGYFDLEIDGTNVNVDYRYIVTCSSNNDNEVLDLQIIGYDVDENHDNITYLDTSTTNISRVVGSGQSSTMRVYVKWIDDEYQTLNDYEQVSNDVGDTTIANNGGSGIVDVNVRFEQRQ